MIAPVIPYLSEELFRNLTGEESVHLAYFPKYNTEYINDALEEKMDTVRTLISIGRNIREEAKIKVREPLSECLLNADLENLIGDLKGLILEELNVKKVVFVNDLDKYMDFFVKPNFKVAGPIFGANIKVFSEILANLTNEEITKLNNNETIHVTIDDTDYEIDSSYTDIRITAKDGYNVGMENNLFVILNTVRSEELILEGIAREFVSKVQNIRKTVNYNVADRITITYNGDEEIKNAVDMFKEYIMNETLATEITVSENINTELDLNGHKAGIITKRV